VSDLGKVDKIIDKWNADPEFVVEMFQDVQDELGHIPQDALEKVSDRTGAPRGRLFHIATFYQAFSLEPRGQTDIQVCMGTTCFVRGAQMVLEALERELGIAAGETTPDGKFSLRKVRCLGCCAIGPVVAVNDEVAGTLRPSDAADFIAGLS
jgi:NADH-quinone oxidoreductase subunit E